jgi:hypothetical protein
MCSVADRVRMPREWQSDLGHRTIVHTERWTLVLARYESEK